MANVVGERFQITVDKRVREQLGVMPGDLAIERVVAGRLVVTFVPRPHRDSLLGVLRQEDAAPIHDWGTVLEDARRARSVEITESLDRRGQRPRRRDR